MRLMVLVAALAAVASPTAAEEWRLIGATRDFTSAIDTTSVAGPASAKRAWTMRVYRDRQTGGFDYALIQREFDCVRKTSTMTAFAAYERGDVFVARDQTRGSADVVVPSSMASLELAAACDGASSEAAGPFANAPATVAMIDLLHSVDDPRTR